MNIYAGKGMIYCNISQGDGKNVCGIWQIKKKKDWEYISDNIVII